LSKDIVPRALRQAQRDGARFDKLSVTGVTSFAADGAQLDAAHFFKGGR
jgi:hypothetical protein